MNKGTSKTRLKTFFLIIGAVAVYLAALSVIDFFALPCKGILQAALLFIVAVAVYIFMRYNLYTYEYNYTDGELIVTSKLGEAEKLIAKVDLNSIEYIAPYGHSALAQTKETYRYNAKSSLSNKGMYVLVFSDEKRRLSKLAFDPSDTLLTKLREAGIQVYGN